MAKPSPHSARLAWSSAICRSLRRASDRRRTNERCRFPRPCSHKELLNMSVRPYRDIHRRKSRQILVGKVPVGGDAPITVQTMTNTITGDARATIDQIRGIEEAGADIVRVSCPDEDATKAMKAIC